MKSISTTWLRPIDIGLLQSAVFERLAKEPNALLFVRGDLAGLPLPQEFVCPLPGENAVVPSRARHMAFVLNHKSWRALSVALQEADWKAERLTDLEVTVDGELAFLVGDSFHPECVSLRSAAPKSLAQRLQELHAAAIYRVA